VILTAGLTPAWQQTLVFDGFSYGQVNRAAEAHWCASGKVFNAGLAAHRLGGPSLALAPVGGPPLELVRNDLGQLGVPHRLVVTRAATRVCTTILDRPTGTMTELVENGRPLEPDELDQFRAAYAQEAAKAAVAVMIGSLPAGTPERFYRDLLALTPCRAFLDFRGQGLLDALDLRPYVVKPNREELGRTVGGTLGSDEELLAAMRMLNHRGAQWVVITQGDGPVWLASAQRAYRFYPPPVQRPVNPLGCGDAMAAGIAWATREGRDIVEAVRLGMAVAAAKLRQLLPAGFDPSEVRLLENAVRVEASQEPS